jgi:hypothetical protein
MPWYNALGFGRRSLMPEAPSLTAAASIISEPRPPLMKPVENWQREAWDFYDELGEFNFAITWLGNMMSRVRLRAAHLDPDLDEPSISDVPSDSLPAQLMRDIAGGVGGQAQMMRNLVVQLSVPGDGYLIGEQLGSVYRWSVRSADEVRATLGKFQVVGSRVPTVNWVDLEPESLVVRVWRPHPRFYHVADSPARSARPIMRELELVNRYITAQYLSRIAMAGLLVLPKEASFPVREEFQDEPDPLSMEFVEIAAEAIREPGMASSIVPLLIRVPSDVADKIRHIDFTLKIDEKVIERRDSAITRLATKLDLPAEVLTGLGSVNHWTAWQLDEGALKTHIAPLAELICDSLTRGYLQPRMAASGEKDIGQWVVWYDMSELAIRPDRSQNAKDTYDRMELSGEALRREGGFDEDDKPDTAELVEQGLKILLRTVPAIAPSALDALVGHPVFQSAESSPASGGKTAGPAESAPPPGTPGLPETGPPPESTPPAGPSSANPPAMISDHLLSQLKTPHAVRFTAVRSPELLHPPICRENAYGCPFTHAAEDAPLTDLATGVYDCRLDSFGRLIIGDSVPYLNLDSWITTGTKILNRRRETNGHRITV